jgi:hypothetical protein
MTISRVWPYACDNGGGPGHVQVPSNSLSITVANLADTSAEGLGVTWSEFNGLFAMGDG